MLGALGVPGVVVLARLTDGLHALETWVYGLVLGVVVGSLAMLGAALVLGRLSLGVVLGVSAVSVAAAAAGRPGTAARFRGVLGREARAGDGEPVPPWPGTRARAAHAATAALGHVGPFSAVVLGAFALAWTVMFARLLVRNDEGLWAGQANVWADWSLHLGDVTSFAYGDNFPPENPRFAGSPLPYHYLTSLTCAAAVRLGMTPAGALALHSLLFCLLCLFGLYAFARRLTRDRDAAGVATGLFLLGGGLGWIVTAIDIDRSKDVVGTLARQPWNPGEQGTHGFRWLNQFAAMIEPQRGYLYGLPLALLILTLLLLGTESWRPRLFVAAGLAAGALPTAHSSTLVALAMLTPVMALLCRTRLVVWARCWALFFGLWIVLALPQMLLQNGGGAGPAHAIRWQVGWLARSGHEPWLWFWAKNLGWFLPLLAVALFDRRLLPAGSRRLIWACMPIFVACNLVAFLPWDWDNTKFLFYWFLAVCVAVGTALTKAWRESASPVVRAVLVGTVATMVLSGVLVNVGQLSGKDRHLLFTAEELHVAELVRERTPAHATFAVDFRHNNPIPAMAGRRVVTGYGGWLFSEGIDYAQREADVRAVFALAPDVKDLVAKYNLDYVVIGPGERREFSPDVNAFRSRFPLIVATAEYQIFQVG
jgi:hypothetical protein